MSQLHSSRWNRNLEDFEILIQWDGLEPEENSWEPVLKLRADIPKMLETFAEDKPDLKAYLSKLNKTQAVLSRKQDTLLDVHHEIHW